MRFLVVFWGTLMYASGCIPLPEISPVFGYIKNFGIPLGEKIRQAEELIDSRIAGGVPAALGQYPFKAGLLGDIVGEDIIGISVCGATLISTSRLLTAAHCWFDGVHQVWRLTVVLGSVTLFQGGTRIQTSAVSSHPNWSPISGRNDIAVVYLASPVAESATISPVALPTGSQLFESFTGERAIAVGFGLANTNGTFVSNQYLSHVNLNVISNTLCTLSYPLVAQASSICTSGIGGVGTCHGDSGGPLVLWRNDRQILIGVSSLLSCENTMPAAYARVTAFKDFINQNL